MHKEFMYFNANMLILIRRCYHIGRGVITQVKVLHLWILDSAIIYYRNCKRNYYINNSYFRILGSINSTVLGQWTVKWVQVTRDLIKDHEIFNFFSSSQSEFHTFMLMKLIGHVKHRREIIIIPQCLLKCGLAQQDDLIIYHLQDSLASHWGSYRVKERRECLFRLTDLKWACIMKCITVTTTGLVSEPCPLFADFGIIFWLVLWVFFFCNFPILTH